MLQQDPFPDSGWSDSDTAKYEAIVTDKSIVQVPFTGLHEFVTCVRNSLEIVGLMTVGSGPAQFHNILGKELADVGANADSTKAFNLAQSPRLQVQIYQV